MVDCMEIPDIRKMTSYFQEYIKDNKISSRGKGVKSLSRHTIKCFTKLGKDRGFYVRAMNNFKDLTEDESRYPNDGGLLDIDLVWIVDNPYHSPGKNDMHIMPKARSEIALALEYEASGGIVKEKDNVTHQCDEIWKLSFVMARVKVLIYPTHTNRIDHHIALFREAISNYGLLQQPNPEWRIFAINDDKVIGKIIAPLK